MLVQVHEWTANKEGYVGVPKVWGLNCSRGARWHASGASLCNVQLLGAVVWPCLLPPGVRGIRADTPNCEDVYGVARNHVMWQVASVGALRCHALEKLGRFILDWDAVAPLYG